MHQGIGSAGAGAAAFPFECAFWFLKRYKNSFFMNIIRPWSSGPNIVEKTLENFIEYQKPGRKVAEQTWKFNFVKYLNLRAQVAQNWCKF